MSNLQLTVSSPELSHKGKVTLIKQYLERCSSKKTTYSCNVSNNQLSVAPVFKSQDALQRVEAGISEILGIACEELSNDGETCAEHYNCCDCGGNNCGCRYCYSCNACPNCLDDN